MNFLYRFAFLVHGLTYKFNKNVSSPFVFGSKIESRTRHNLGKCGIQFKRINFLPQMGYILNYRTSYRD